MKDVHDFSPLPFNPFIHGTTSRIFSLMEQTNFQMLSPIEMIEQFSLAPNSGEINKGGLDTPNANCKPCFGRLISSGYNLSRVLGYTSVCDKETDYNRFLDALDFGFANSFININVILIYAARLKQKGIPFLFDLSKLERNIKLAINKFYLYLFISNYMVPTPEFRNMSDQKMKDRIYYSHAESQVFNVIQEQGLDIKYLYEKPTHDHIEIVLNLLNTNILGITIFTLRTDEIKFVPNPDTRHPRYYFLELAHSSLEYNLEMHLTKFDSGWNQLFPAREFILEQVQALEHRSALLFKILSTEISTPKRGLSKQAQDLFEHPIPIILLCPETGNIEMEEIYHEYRAERQALHLGHDITMIATDTLEHAKRLHDYLASQHLESIEIFTFEQLKESISNGMKPTPYTHLPDAIEQELKYIGTEIESETTSIVDSNKTNVSIQESFLAELFASLDVFSNDFQQNMNQTSILGIPGFNKLNFVNHICQFIMDHEFKDTPNPIDLAVNRIKLFEYAAKTSFATAHAGLGFGKTQTTQFFLNCADYLTRDDDLNNLRYRGYSISAWKR